MSSVSAEEISDEFDVFGAEVNDEQLLKLQEMCRSYNLDAISIVNHWMAFSSSRKIGLTLESLQMFDREWLPKKLLGSQQKTPQPKRTKLLNKDTLGSILDDQLDVVGSYATPEDKRQIAQSKRQLTPEDINNSNKRFVGYNRSPSVKSVFSPTVKSSAGSTPSGKFSSRSNAGDIVQKFGNTNVSSWKGDNHGVSVDSFGSVPMITSQIKYMFQKMSEKGYVLNDIIQDMSTILQNAHGIEEFTHVALPSQESVTVAGRVCCDSIGRLNSQSVLLEGSRETSSGQCISLDLSELLQYSLFPGQVIACEGVNNTGTGTKFAVKNIFSSVALPFPEKNKLTGTGKIRMIIGVGPFTPSDALDYSPLAELLKTITRDQPDVCILMGPFVDSKHVMINNGELLDSFQDLFIKQMEEIGRATKDSGCQVVIVSSYRDVHHYHSVYPQPPYYIPEHNPDGSKRSHVEIDLTKHLKFVSDPSTLCVNGIVIGLTSTDILLHLSKSEISVGPQGKLDRLGRLAQHVLHQHSYYPLYPPAEDVSIDYELWEAHAKLVVTPHILILPSDLKAFIKDIDGCCCVNPGRLTTGTVGGTFAQIEIDTDLITELPLPSSACVGQIVRV